MIAWLRSLEGLAVICGALALGLWAAIQAHDAKVAARIETTIERQAQKEGAARATKAQKARDRARAPGAVDRLRSDAAACPDCR
jgi:hypothetical protein